MFAVRATRKLLRRVPTPSLDLAPTTTLLGDWFANVLIVRRQHLVLAVSERTMLPVVVRAADMRQLPTRIAEAVREILLAIGVAPQAVEREVVEMQTSAFATTNSRRVLGGLNEFMFQLEDAYHAHPEFSLRDHSLRLARTPSGVIERVFPDQAACALLEAAEELRC
jgi:hypothetical protein